MLDNAIKLSDICITEVLTSVIFTSDLLPEYVVAAQRNEALQNEPQAFMSSACHGATYL